MAKDIRKPGGKLPRARAAICRAIKSLIERGLLRRTKSRRRWCLSVLGEKVARLVRPQLVRPVMRELIPEIKEAYQERKKIGRLAPGTDLKIFIRNCFRPGVRTPLDSPTG